MPRCFFGRIAAAVLAMAAVSAGCLFLGGWTTDYYTNGSKQVMDNLGIHAVLAANGDMTVTENWKVLLDDRGRPYSNLYRTFPDDTSKTNGITGLSVYDEDRRVQYRFAGDVDPEEADSTEMANRCYLHDDGTTTEIGWFMPSIEAGTRSFSVTYTVKNIVQVYSDTAELYNFFVPENFSLPITSLSGTVQFPSGGSKSAVRAWLHTSLPNSGISVDSANQVSFTASQIPAKTPVEVRMLMPKTLFAQSSRRSDSASAGSIEAEELQEASENRAKRQREYLLGIIDVVAGALVLLGSIALFIAAKKKSRRIRVEVPEYTRDIPQGNSPAGIANLFYFYSGMKDKENERVYSATMLSLARKGYLQFDSEHGRKEITFIITGKTEQKPLTESEQIFYEILSTASEECGRSFTTGMLRQYAEKHCKFFSGRMQEFLSASKREIAGRGYYGKRPGLLTVLSVVGPLMIFVSFAFFGVTVSSNSAMVYLSLGMFLGGILLLIAGCARTKLTAQGEYDYAVWHGLKKYMLEFSRMKEYGVPELPLWEEYLVYATMMGISGEVCKQLKLVYPQLGDASYWDSAAGYSYLPFLFGPRYGVFGAGPAFGGADFSAALGSAIGQIGSAATRLANPPQSSGFGGGGFGGGGFSGGGGGFGGGGGGGVR